MYKLTAAMIFLTGLISGLAQADPKCYTGPIHRETDNTALWQCVDSEEKNPQWHEWDCQNKHFQYWSNGHWGSPGDCLGGCVPCLEGAAELGAEWVKCDQQASSAHCAVGWSPPGQAFCSNGDEGPC
ncbi:hypothetical protein SCUP234_10509 [Seiridium cupressi]